MKIVKPETKTIGMERFVELISKIQQEQVKIKRPGAMAKDVPIPFNSNDLNLILDAVILHYLFS